MLPNPLWDAGSSAGIPPALLTAARGGVDETGEWWFTGRATELNQVCKWVRSGVAGLHLIIGAPGCGKSALLGLVAALADSTESQRATNGYDHGAVTGPGIGSVHAVAQARGSTADHLATTIDAALIRAEVLRPAEELRNAAELTGALQRIYTRGRPPPVVLVDGLDEAAHMAGP
ncbi:ATP-binding protein, partial [Nocardia gipuzkoensis]